MAIDFAHEETDRIIARTEKRIKKEYQKAAKEVNEKLNKYWRKFEDKDKKWRQWVKEGKETEESYRNWRKGQLIVGKRWEDLQTKLANEYHDANMKATKIVRGMQAETYALNYNYSAYGIEKELGIDTGFTVYNKDAVERMLKDNPDVLPKPGKHVSQRIAEGKDVLWNKRALQSVATQGILQGDSIPELAKRLAEAVGDSNYKAAVRNARTMATGAQNAGRIDSYLQAEEIGVRLKQQWMAVLDGRTRHEHRELDGQVVDVGEPFTVDGEDIMFPGDPDAPPYLVYNCRCKVLPVIQGHEIDTTKYRRDPDFEGMSYEEWKDSKPTHSRPLTMTDRREQKRKQKK